MKRNFLILVITTVLMTTVLGQNAVDSNKGTQINEFAALRDYYSIAKSAIDSTENYLYNPAILKTAEWIDFTNNVLELSKVVSDDNEFVKMFNINGRKLPFTHFGISLKESDKSASGEKSQAVTRKEQPKKFEIKQADDETVVFTVKTFSASAEEIIPFIDTLKAMSFSNLIIDLRRNSGGTIASALPLAEYLVQDTLMGGAFLTQKYFSKHSSLPEAGSYRNFPLFSEASFSLIISGIHNQEGLCLIIYPDAKSFKGDLYILTDKYTASTCEPLVYGLKTSKRATVIGEKTYGAMLNGEIFGIGDSFNLWIPTADYYTADGFKIDKVGVTPDIDVDPADALEKALEVIQGKKR